MDLGRKMKAPGSEPASPVSAKEPKVTYPGFSLNDEIADSFLKEYDCDLGDEITATVKLKVTSLRKDEYGNSVGFDVLSLDDVQDSGKTDEDENGKKKSDDDEASDEETKTLGYKRPTVKKETPSVSAKDLAD